jgi:hypothetical protein
MPRRPGRSWWPPSRSRLSAFAEPTPRTVRPRHATSIVATFPLDPARSLYAFTKVPFRGTGRRGADPFLAVREGRLSKGHAPFFHRKFEAAAPKDGDDAKQACKVGRSARFSKRSLRSRRLQMLGMTTLILPSETNLRAPYL